MRVTAKSLSRAALSCIVVVSTGAAAAVCASKIVSIRVRHSYCMFGGLRRPLCIPPCTLPVADHRGGAGGTLPTAPAPAFGGQAGPVGGAGGVGTGPGAPLPHLPGLSPAGLALLDALQRSGPVR